MLTIPDMISHDEIAALVGSTRQWVTMMLECFKTEEVAIHRGRSFQIFKADRLQEIADGSKT